MYPPYDFMKITEDKLTKEEFIKNYGFDNAIPFNIFKRQDIGFFRKFTLKYWKDKKILDKELHRANLIHMELNNGMHRTFLVKETNQGFYYFDKRYIFDLKMRYYDIDADLFCYDFHEGLTFPFKRNFPATDIKRTLEKSPDMKGFEVSYSA